MIFFLFKQFQFHLGYIFSSIKVNFRLRFTRVLKKSMQSVNSIILFGNSKITVYQNQVNDKEKQFFCSAFQLHTTVQPFTISESREKEIKKDRVKIEIFCALFFHPRKIIKDSFKVLNFYTIESIRLTLFSQITRIVIIRNEIFIGDVHGFRSPLP